MSDNFKKYLQIIDRLIVAHMQTKQDDLHNMTETAKLLALYVKIFELKNKVDELHSKKKNISLDFDDKLIIQKFLQQFKNES